MYSSFTCHQHYILSLISVYLQNKASGWLGPQETMESKLGLNLDLGEKANNTLLSET